MEFRIYPLTDTSRLPELCVLFAKGLAKTTPEYWLWKHYSDNGLPKGMVLIADDESGKMRAIFAMQPAWYRQGNSKIMLVQLEDLVIDPECRGQGLMRKLYSYTMDYYRTQGAAGLIGLSANDKSYAVLTSYGFCNLGGIRSFRTSKTLIPHFSKNNYRKEGWNIVIGDAMPDDLFFSSHSSSFKLEKNQQFIEWKFNKSPEHAYQWLTIRRDGVLEGYIIFYVNKGRLRSAVNICDWELNESINDWILRKTVKILQSKGNWVSLWGRLDDRSAARWHQAGLTIENQDKDYFIYYPIDDSQLPVNWHITKADSDN
jgi:GNAT superfamily N-acetyltransferase